MTRAGLIAFDFDGVLCNSIHDSFMTAVNAYLDVEKQHRLPLVGPLTSEDVLRFEEGEPSVFRHFRTYIPLCNRAMDYYVLLKILDEGAEEITDQAAFDSVKASIPTDRLTDYQERFYALRREMQQKPELWSALLPAFPGIARAVRTLSHRFELAIATAKDTDSVTILLKKYGLHDLFRPENILDKDVGKTKRDHLRYLHRSLGISYPDMHFIDDKVSHLLIVKDLGVRGYLAAWGFNSEREREIARTEGFNILKKDDLIRLNDDE